MVSEAEKDAKERIRYLLKIKKCSFTDVVGKSDSKRIIFSRQVNGDSKITFDSLHQLAYMFHDISCDWLLLGEGSMQKAEHVGSRIYNTTNVAQDNQCGGDINVGTTRPQVIRDREIEEREQIIAQLRQQVEELKRDKQLNQGIIEALIAGQKK